MYLLKYFRSISDPFLCSTLLTYPVDQRCVQWQGSERTLEVLVGETRDVLDWPLFTDALSECALGIDKRCAKVS